MIDDVPTCRKCHAPIRWAATIHGKMQPLDREDNPDGNIRLLDEYVLTERGVLQRAVVVKEGETLSLLEDNGVRYMPHHATCPFAAEFRKPKAS